MVARRSRNTRKSGKSRRMKSVRSRRTMKGGAIICDKLRAQHNFLQLLRMNNNNAIRMKKIYNQGSFKRKIIKTILLFFIGINKSMRVLCSRPDVRLTENNVRLLKLSHGVDASDLKPFGFYSKDILNTGKTYLTKSNIAADVLTAVTSTSPQTRETIVKKQLKHGSQALDRLVGTGFGLPMDDKTASYNVKQNPILQKFIRDGVENAAANRADVQRVTNIIQAGIDGQKTAQQTLESLNRFAGDRGVSVQSLRRMGRAQN